VVALRRARFGGRTALAGPRADCPLWLSQGGEFASEEDERVAPRRDVKAQDLPEDDRVVAGEVLGELSSPTRA
jgi:hypothetical protein